jgi:hypothetical protein
MNEQPAPDYDPTPKDKLSGGGGNDHVETWDHLCGPDPNWLAALENDDDDTRLPRR